MRDGEAGESRSGSITRLDAVCKSTGHIWGAPRVVETIIVDDLLIVSRSEWAKFWEIRATFRCSSFQVFFLFKSKLWRSNEVSSCSNITQNNNPVLPGFCRNEDTTCYCIMENCSWNWQNNNRVSVVYWPTFSPAMQTRDPGFNSASAIWCGIIWRQLRKYIVCTAAICATSWMYLHGLLLHLMYSSLVGRISSDM